MAAGFLWRLVLTEAGPISTTPELCKRVRHRQSECRKCVDSCPENAITVNLGPRISEACTRCGLCVSVCPTEVFEHGFDLDQYFLDQIKSLLGESRTSNRKKSLHIHCPQGKRRSAESHRVECLANVTENVMLGAALLGLDELVLSRGNCSRCRLVRGEVLFRDAIKTFEVWQQSLGLNGFELRLEQTQKQKGDKVELSRRAFFSKLTDRLNEKSMPVGKSVAKPPCDEAENQFVTRPSPKRELLRKLLRQPRLHNDVAGVVTASPWRTMKVDEKNCIACGICVAVCPTGALRKEYEHSQLVRYFDSALCTNCSLCEEACPKQVISFETVNNVGDWVIGKTMVVARIELSSCTICGETITQAEGRVCITCQKRQLSPLII